MKRWDHNCQSLEIGSVFRGNRPSGQCTKCKQRRNCNALSRSSFPISRRDHTHLTYVISIETQALGGRKRSGFRLFFKCSAGLGYITGAHPNEPLISRFYWECAFDIQGNVIIPKSLVAHSSSPSASASNFLVRAKDFKKPLSKLGIKGWERLGNFVLNRRDCAGGTYASLGMAQKLLVSL